MASRLQHYWTEEERAYASMLLRKGYTRREIASAVTEKFGWPCTPRSVSGQVLDQAKVGKDLFLDAEKTIELAELDQINRRVDLDKPLMPATINLDLSEVKLPVGIAWFSDIHLGHENCNYKKLDEVLNLVSKTPGLLSFLGGDSVCNFIIPKLAHAAQKCNIKVEDQYIKLYDWLLDKASKADSALGINKLLGSGYGNHEYWTKRLAYLDLHSYITKASGHRTSGIRTFININVGGNEYLIYRAHRHRGFSSLNSSNNFRWLYNDAPKPFDVGVLEDKHHSVGGWWPQHGESRYFIRPGSFIPADDYALELGFFGGSIRVPVTVFHPKNRHITVFEYTEDAVCFLEGFYGK